MPMVIIIIFQFAGGRWKFRTGKYRTGKCGTRKSMEHCKCINIALRIHCNSTY